MAEEITNTTPDVSGQAQVQTEAVKSGAEPPPVTVINRLVPIKDPDSVPRWVIVAVLLGTLYFFKKGKIV